MDKFNVGDRVVDTMGHTGTVTSTFYEVLGIRFDYSGYECYILTIFVEHITVTTGPRTI